MPNSADGGPAAEYREAMLRGASLAWEERWEAAAAAYRRALAARPSDPAAERQLALALSRVAGLAERATAPAANPAREPIAAGRSGSVNAESSAQTAMNGALLGRTASAHLGELSELPREMVRRVIESLRAIERHQAAAHYSAAFEDAFTLLQWVPTFLPLHILLAELSIETGQWQAGRDKLEAVEAVYGVRGRDERKQAAA